MGFTATLTEIFGLPTSLDPITQRQIDGITFELRIRNYGYNGSGCATIGFFGKGVNVGFGDKCGVGFGIVRRLAPLEPLIQLARVGVDSRFFLVLVAPYRKPFGLFPALDGSNFAAQMRGDLFPRNHFLVAVGRSALHGPDRANKSIPEPGNGFDILRICGRITDDRAEFFDRRIQALLEVDKGLRRPELVAQFFACYEFPRFAEKLVENLKGLRAQLELDAVLE